MLWITISGTIDFVKTFPQLAPVRSDYRPLVTHSDGLCHRYYLAEQQAVICLPAKQQLI